MKDKIIIESIESLKQEGLKFSVDTLADKLRISKKTIYKYFPDKETLALALYEKYYEDLTNQVKKMMSDSNCPDYSALLHLYFDSKVMMRGEIFNKYKLNATIYSYVVGQSDELWKMISSCFIGVASDDERNMLRIIIDGTFEKLCNMQISPDAVIERLVDLL